MNDSVVKSVGRVFEVLELFDAERIALSATSVARALKYPASSTVALLKSMVRLGYLTYDHTERTYFPTVRLAAISYWLEHSFFLEGHLLQLMENITNSTQESAFLSWQSDLDMQSIGLRAIGPSDIAPSPAVGSRLSLFGTVAGLMALTPKRDVDIIKLLDRLNHMRRQDLPQADATVAMRQIRQFRTLGYGIGYDDLAPGVSSLAWILKQKGTARSVVFSVYGPTERMKAKEKTIVSAVKLALKRQSA